MLAAGGAPARTRQAYVRAGAAAQQNGKLVRRQSALPFGQHENHLTRHLSRLPLQMGSVQIRTSGSCNPSGATMNSRRTSR